MTLHPFLSPVGMRCESRVGTAKLRCRAELQNLANWCTEFHNPLCMALPCCPPFAQGGLFFGPVSGQPNCAAALNYRIWLTGALSFTIPPAWRCHAVPPFAQGGLFFGPVPQKRLVGSAWLRQGPRREAGKRSGKNLVFPRDPAAASPDGLQVILALCQNNTPPMAQEGPGGFRRWEETWGNTRRSGCSGYEFSLFRQYCL